ncbi:MAG: hypothetical protein ACPGO3_02410 [Magnetospiraceae bacterium]
MDIIDERKVFAALTQAMRLLEEAVQDQEKAVNRILGMAEQIEQGAANQRTALKAEAIIETCGFQDLTGQKIRKVARLVKFLRDKRLVDVDELPSGPIDLGFEERKPEGLSQKEVDKLLGR